VSGKVVWLNGFVALCSVLLCTVVGAESTDGLFARVAGETISRAEYETAVNVAVRQHFYHGRVDDGRLGALRHQVAGELIDRVLLRQEAVRRGIKVDAAAVEKEAAHEAGRYRLESLPQERRRHMDEMLRRQAQERLLLQALEQKVKALPELSEADARTYYSAHLDKFTTPPQLRLALILLKVEPSAPVESWKAAQQEAQRLQRKLAAGADFAGLAQLHSGDASAERGGDLGFVHQGMLAAEAQQAVDALKVGEVTSPVTLLQGVALFKLLERQSEIVNPFERVNVRAKGLLQRERSEQAWGGLLQALRNKAQVEIFDKEITTTMIWADVPAAKR
jgi:parvulin-like peptidyl-prolyl isomerase